MPTTNYDASVRTKLYRTRALYAFYVENQAAVNAGRSVRREQPDTQLNTVLLQRKEAAANQLNTTSCPCSEPVTVNEGGGNSNNVQ